MRIGDGLHEALTVKLRPVVVVVVVIRGGCLVSGWYLRGAVKRRGG